MNAAHSNRFLKIVIILLIIINAMVLIMHLRVTGGRREGPPGGHGSQLKYKLIHDLEMDEQQEISYSEMVDRHRAAMNDIKRQEEETRKVLYADMGNKDKNRDSLFNEMAQLRREREIVTFTHFMELRGILKPEQAAKFDNIIGESVNGMEGPPRRN